MSALTKPILGLTALFALLVSACATPIVIPHNDGGGIGMDAGVELKDGGSMPDAGYYRPDVGQPPYMDANTMGDGLGDGLGDGFGDGDIGQSDGDIGPRSEAGAGDGATAEDGAVEMSVMRVDGAFLD